MGQSLKGTLAGLKAACDSIYADAKGPLGAPVLVSYGWPGSDQPDAVVAVGTDVRQPVTRPTMGTNRSREKLVEIEVLVSVWSGGGEEVQQTVTESCSDLVDALEAYFRTAGQETLGGGCMDSWVSDIAGPTPNVSTDSSGNATGRLADSIVTVTARIRY